MKKSKVVKLVLIASVAASCSSHDDYVDANNKSRLYIRSDSTSQYSHTPYYGGYGYYHFMPFGYYHPWYGYRHGGYDSPGFSSKAGNHAISRGGFGGSGMRVGS